MIPVLDPMRGSLLVRGQKYRVVVDLEMPESPVNQRIGNAGVSLRPGVLKEGLCLSACLTACVVECVDYLP